jgi:hypothetical protein
MNNSLFEILREANITKDLAKELPESFFIKMNRYCETYNLEGLFNELGPLREQSKINIQNMLRETYNERKYYLKTKAMLREKIDRAERKKLEEKQLGRLREISKRYKECKNDLYFAFLDQNHLKEWKDPRVGHALYIQPLRKSDPLWETFQILADKNLPLQGMQKLQETTSVQDMMQQAGDAMNVADMMNAPIRESIEDLMSSSQIEPIPQPGSEYFTN